MDVFLTALSTIFQFKTLIWMFGGVAFGILLGALPGLTATTALILGLPLTYSMASELAFPFLISIYVGGISGGLISAILLKIPGTPSSITTTFDGHPMLQNGEGARALGFAFISSFMGTVLSWLCLVIVAPKLANIALSFGPQEYFMVIVVALSAVISLSGKKPIKGFIAAIIGLMLSCVGRDPVAATMRIVDATSIFGGGFAIVPALVGLFGISEILNNMITNNYFSTQKIKVHDMFSIIRELPKHTVNILRSALIGIFIGLIPAVGGNVGNLLAYDQAKRNSKYPEKFGTGIPDGIIASETSNNAVIGGAMVPLLTLGIPGDGCTAIIFGAFLIHGLQPGPLVFINNPTLMYVIYLALLISSFLMLIVGMGGINVFIRSLNTPNYILFPVVFILCVIGSFSANNNMNDVWTLLLFGAIGYASNKLEFPLAPLILGLILGPIAELNLRRALMISDGSFMTFVTRPISFVLLVIAIVAIVLSIRTVIKEVYKFK
ncbi:MAG: tripartite tricarboxylate transporter permease [Bacilli bacterium]|nr:tripartite tricarboxylate transporter permease [Bacilli bacterium]